MDRPLSRFATLSRPRQLRLLRAAALTGLSAFDLPPGRLRLVQYELNGIYQLTSPSGKFFLRLSTRPDLSSAHIASEMRWLARLSEIRRPVPLMPSAGEWVVELPDFPAVVVMTTWLDGRVPRITYDTPLAADYGRIVATVHAQADGFTPDVTFIRPVMTFQSITAALSDNLPEVDRVLGDDAAGVLTAAARRIGSGAPAETGREILIHGDLHRGNFLCSRRGELAVIDFEDCGWGHDLLDIAAFLDSVARLDRSEPSGYQTFAHRFLEGYASQRPLPAMAEFTDYLALRDLVVVNYLARSVNPTVAEWRERRLRELVGQLAAYVETGVHVGSLRL
ncbi:phosphotransferase enzyme family protein [Kutzneria sp. CA-103260]|uniref:phosphotransferase enzyme family protein n=1 Tax=Kutzneria sp. CA-103260 TaxID=2802641 RepID=UPI001BA50F9C|nr:phosphotransferase [Kutzneria sp. CA-103260]QUQ71741.1 aminoglycoside phosphotransferase [Kutzneria sp. CA-103260]